MGFSLQLREWFYLEPIALIGHDGMCVQEGWRVQWEINPPGKKSKPCSLGSNMEENQDVEAYRQPYHKGKDELSGRSESESRRWLR